VWWPIRETQAAEAIAELITMLVGFRIQGLASVTVTRQRSKSGQLHSR
jgi:uncharacterized membrane protein